MPTIYLYYDMIQLFSTLVVPTPTNVKGICTPSGSSTTYGNWGYAQINAVVIYYSKVYKLNMSIL